VARRLTEPLEVVETLAENACHDAVPAVRLENLLCLMREFPTHPRTHEALAAACRDPSPEMRLRAASAVGAAGVEVLMELADGLVADDVSAARAVYALGRRLPFDRVCALLDRALRSRRPSTARACLDTLGRRGEEATPLIAKVLAVESGELAVAAAVALGTSGAASAEAPLLAALDRDVPGLGIAAAEALGHVGSATAVLPLKEAARSASDRGFQRAARQAIGSIQARAGGATPGQLSLTAVPTGQLSVTDGQEGRVSYPRGESGRVSLDGNEKG
jgi:HEAT repeat protein